MFKISQQKKLPITFTARLYDFLFVFVGSFVILSKISGRMKSDYFLISIQITIIFRFLYDTMIDIIDRK